MYHQISKRRSVSQEQNTLLKSQNPGNVGFIEKLRFLDYQRKLNYPQETWKLELVVVSWFS